MSAIPDLIKILSLPAHDPGAELGAIATAGDKALPDLQRLVSWVESAEHSANCHIHFPSMGTFSVTADGKFESKITQPSVCTCGLDSIKSLIRS